MEVYKIINVINNKIYIGSTIYTKEYRWNDKNSGFSHINCSKDIKNKSPLYEDIRKYGSDSFSLETLEFVEYNDKLSKNENRHIIQLKEDYYIKYYWNKVGADNIYNVMKSAFTNSDGNQFHTLESIKKSKKTRIERYGRLVPVTDKDIQRRTETNIRNSSGIFSNKALHRRGHVYKYNGKIYYGITNLYNKLISEGYDLSWNQVRRIALYKEISRSNLDKYPNILDSIVIFKKGSDEWYETTK